MVDVDLHRLACELREHPNVKDVCLMPGSSVSFGFVDNDGECTIHQFGDCRLGFESLVSSENWQVLDIVRRHVSPFPAGDRAELRERIEMVFRGFGLMDADVGGDTLTDVADAVLAVLDDGGEIA